MHQPQPPPAVRRETHGGYVDVPGQHKVDAGCSELLQGLAAPARRPPAHQLGQGRQRMVDHGDPHPPVAFR